MKCHNCQAQLEPADRFCGECGAAVRAADESPPSSAAPQATESPPPSAAPEGPEPPPATEPPAGRDDDAGASLQSPLPPAPSPPTPPLVAPAPPATPATPSPPPAPIVAEAEPRRRRGCLRSCLIVALVGACLLAVLAGGGYFLFQNGTINRGMIEGMLTGGRGEISVANLTDAFLEAKLIQLEGTEDGQPQTYSSVELDSLDIGPIGSIPPGRYELIITGSDTNPPEALCRMRIEGGDVYQIVAVPEGIAITLEGEGAATVDDVDVVTSPLCNR